MTDYEDINQVVDELILRELGEWLARVRLERNLTQAGLAEQAGVSKRTVERMEAGGVTQLVNLVRVCRALDLLERFEVLIPEPVASPVAQLKRRGKERQRASSAKAATAPSGKWQVVMGRQVMTTLVEVKLWGRTIGKTYRLNCHT